MGYPAVLCDGDCGRPECLQHGQHLVSMGVEAYLVNVVWSYLSDRVVQTKMGEF